MKVRGWLAVGLGGFVVYAVASQINWGYYLHTGINMADDLSWPITTGDKVESAALAAEVCGDPTMEFDRHDPSATVVSFAEQATVRHFFLNSRYSNIIWLGVGWKGRFCLARYKLVMKDHGWMSPFPRRLLPFPLLEWNYRWEIEEQRLIERLPERPAAPEGVRSLFPGECATGEIHKGETLRFQVVMPSFGQKVEVLSECDGRKSGHPSLEEWRRCVEKTPDNCWPDYPPLKVELKKDGHLLARESDEPGGGTYEISIRAQSPTTKHYRVALYWGEFPGCPARVGWVE